MPLPTLEKTWQFNVNKTFPPDTDPNTYAAMLLHIKNTLLGWGWTVVGSSDAATAGLDGGDRWTAVSKLVWAATASAKSWFVLKNTRLGANFQMLWVLDWTPNNSQRNWHLFVSYNAGFTGGTVIARPTATDEHSIIQGGSPYWFVAASGVGAVLHMMQSTDGKALRIIGYVNKRPQSFFFLEEVKNPTPGWAAPVIAYRMTNTTATVTPSYTEMSDIANIRFRHVSTNYTGYLTGEMVIDNTMGEKLGVYPNEITGEWALYGIGFASLAAGARGKHGNLTDLYWCSTDALEGTFFNPERTWVKMGVLAFPWNGSNIVIAN